MRLCMTYVKENIEFTRKYVEETAAGREDGRP